MRRQPEKYMALMLTLLLMACSREEKTEQTASQVAASAAQKAEIASAILASDAAQDDILQARREAKAQVSASDIAAMENMSWDVASGAFQAASVPENLPPLHAVCEQYFQRVDACFARQGEDANTLRAQNQEARIAVMREQPDEATCVALNNSFQQVAMNLGCE